MHEEITDCKSLIASVSLTDWCIIIVLEKNRYRHSIIIMILVCAGVPLNKTAKQNYCHDYYNLVHQGILQTYLDHVTLQTNQSYFFHFGIDGATDWTMVNENELAKNISVVSDQALMVYFNMLFYDVVLYSDLTFFMQADNSFNPSVLTVVEIDTQQEKEMIINYGGNQCVLTLTDTKDRMKCTSYDARRNHACGQRNMPNKGQVSNRLLLKSVFFQPRGPGSYTYKNQWWRNQYTWSGTKHLIIGETRKCPFIGKCCRFIPLV